MEALILLADKKFLYIEGNCPGRMELRCWALGISVLKR
jgi:hypothetical protein